MTVTELSFYADVLLTVGRGDRHDPLKNLRATIKTRRIRLFRLHRTWPISTRQRRCRLLGGVVVTPLRGTGFASEKSL